MRGFQVISRVTPLVALFTVAAFVPSVSASASPAPSTTSPLTMQRVQAAPHIPDGATATGALSSTASVTGAVVLKPRDNAALTAFIADVTTKGSPAYHDYLAPGAFAGRFGPTHATIATVKRALEADGLHVTNVASDGLLLSFTGSADAVESTFHTGLTRYRLANGSKGQATTSAVELPSDIATSVSSVVGLNDLVQEQPAGITTTSTPPPYPAAKAPKFAHPAGSPTACSAATADAESFGGLTDDQIANAYGAFGLYKAGDVGTGQHIGIFELEPFLASDIQTFDTCYFGATAASAMISRLNTVNVDGGNPAGPGSGEAILDIDDVSAMAPGADIDVYEAPNNSFGAIDEYAAIVDNDVDNEVSSSWAECEQAIELAEPGIQQAENFLFEQAAAQGQSVFSSSGDTGDDECNEFRYPYPISGQNPLSVLDPGSQPYVVSVGGTTITDATEPPTEQVWNDGANWGAGGGGISQSWAQPAWQQDSKVPGIVEPGSTDYTQANGVETALGYPTGFCQSTLPGATADTACRTVPDVSAQADEFTGAVTVYSTEFESPSSPDGWSTIGGTSSSSPIWASMLALINASATCASNPATATGVGFVSPLLYGVASNAKAYAASFNDVTVGNNDIYGLDNGQVFPATTGYDLASGLGSPRLTGKGGTAGLAAYLCAYAGSTKATAPTVSGLTPSFLPTTGGTVTITGTGFMVHKTSDVAGVQVGSFALPATAVTVNSSTSITATFPVSADTLPPGSPSPQDGSGPANVIVSLLDGKSSAASAVATLEYVDESAGNVVPSVTGVSPYGGSEAGAAPVTIFGSGFTGATQVTFGGVPATGFTIKSPYEITLTPPAYGAETCGPSVAGESPTTDICQVQVQVTNAYGTSTDGTILPPYEGPTLPYTNMAVTALPPDCGCEEMPAPTEYDYVPVPTVTSISTSQGPASLADAYGGTVVTVTGTGFDPLTGEWANIGDPTQDSSVYYCENPGCIYVSGTEVQFEAPPIVATGAPAPVQPTSLPFSIKTIAGQSNELPLTWAGVPTVTAVANTSGTGSVDGVYGSADTGGTAVTVTGAGFDQAVGPIGFVDAASPFSLGTQYNYDVASDTSIGTETVQQNPALVDVEVCSVSGCSYNPPADLYILYPPGSPVVTSVSPKSGPAAGGTEVVITGQNLGCVTGVFFGTVPAATFSNAEALLDCGSFDTVDVTAPPGTAGTKVPVTVTTVESEVTGSGPSTSKATFTYKKK